MSKMRMKLTLALLLMFLMIPSYSFATIVLETTGWIVGTESITYSFSASESPYT